MAVLAPFDLPSACLFAGFLGETPCFACADGQICFPARGQTVQAALGGLTAAAQSADSRFLFTGGEDGAVCRLKAPAAGDNAAPQPQLLANSGGKWIDYLAASADGGSFAFSCGRRLCFGAAAANAPLREWRLERSAEGLAFSAKGLRLAAAHYNGASLYWPNSDAAPTKLEWKGAHTGIIFSPDRRYIITAMQENALHGWRLEDGQHLRMSGYPAKVKSLSWSAKGRYLATSGAPAAILWPFISKDGPMDKAPLELGTRGDSLATCVACHPQRDIVAVGYADGMILLVSFAAAESAAPQEKLLRRGGNGAITAMNWDKTGFRLAFGAESGEAGLINLS